MLRFIAEKYFRKFLVLFWLIATSPPFLAFIWLFETHEQLRSKLSFFGFILFIVWMLASWWLGLTTAHYLFEKKLLFLAAIKQTLRDLCLKLSVFFGYWFTSNESKIDHDDDDDL